MAEKYNDTCEANSQCDHLGVPGQVICYEKKCQCAPPKQFHNRVCVEAVNLNGSCANVNQCHLGVNNLTLCIRKLETDPPEKWCQCMPNAMAGDDGLCYILKPVGDSCVNDVECKMGIIGPVYCNPTTRKCTCENGYKEDTGGIRCSGGSSVLHHLNGIGLLIGILATKIIS